MGYGVCAVWTGWKAEERYDLTPITMALGFVACIQRLPSADEDHELLSGLLIVI